MILKCIAVDDEPLALGLLCSFIEQTPFLKLIGRFSSGVKALEAIDRQEVDLIFSDIQMPDLTGIQLARTLSAIAEDKRPKVVFTTAYSNFALEGYKVDALDYLLKPFDYEEFLHAAHKAKNHALRLNTNLTPVPKQEYIFLKVEYQLIKVAIADIVYIEGLKDYVKVHLVSDSKPLLTLITMKSLEEKLPADKFMRIHRSFIIALEKIEAITKNAIQIGGTNITIGDQYKDSVKQFLSDWM